MAKKGGYKIIDFKGVNHTLDVGMVHKGIYESIEESTKPFLLSGLVLEDMEIRDIWCNVTQVGNSFFFVTSGVSIKIDDTDVVTITTQA